MNMAAPVPSEIPVVILCGGEGTRFREETRVTPKPLLELGSRPIIWHVINLYHRQGFRRFILCLGYKGWMIKEFFLHLHERLRDFTLNLNTGSVRFHDEQDLDLQITFAETGEKTMTGARVKRIEPYITGEHFCVTYADGLANVQLGKLLAFHASHGKVGTVTGVRSVSQFGQLAVDGSQVQRFSEKPNIEGLINGGFFVFRRSFFQYLSADENCVLEREPMERLSRDGGLHVFRHDGFWQCMDTFKDYQILSRLAEEEPAPWERIT